jgi:hypothetical protein
MPAYASISAAIERVIIAISTNPVLGLFVLNAFGIGVAVWFLDRLITNNDERLDMLLKSCLPH